MYGHHRQQGVTFAGLVIILVLIGFFALVAMKLFPVYMESFKVDQALDGLIEQTDIEKKSNIEIRNLFMRHMEIEMVDRFDMQNIKEIMQIKKKQGSMTISMVYQTKAPLFGNLSILAEWDKQVSK